MADSYSGSRHVSDDIDYIADHHNHDGVNDIDDTADHNHDSVNDIDYYEYTNILHPDSQHVR